jgi:hypothetical protein
MTAGQRQFHALLWPILGLLLLVAIITLVLLRPAPVLP